MKKAILSSAALVALVVAGCGTNQTSSNAAPAASSTNTSAPAATGSNSTSGNNPSAVASSAALKVQSISMTVLPGARLGSDGKMHDTFTDPNFTVEAGIPVKLTVYNYDSGEHTVTNSQLGLNLVAKGSSKTGVPAVTTVTFTPKKAGDYMWQCMKVCDGENGGWAMTHMGYMQGMIDVVPYQNKQYIDLAIKDGLQYAAADGKLHDSFSPASFAVQRGIPVQVTVENFDTGNHSMFSSTLGLNQTIAGAKKTGVPTVTTFTFTPAKDGTFQWMCTIQCDGNGWAMGHNGYMAGQITVTG